MGISKQVFGKLGDGRTAWLYKLADNLGATAYITDFGGAVVKLLVPDRTGKLDDVVCGYDDLDSYMNGDGYQGALIGRCGNRIADGRFTLDGKEYCLHCNDGSNHLHGGKNGFSHRLWDAELLDDELILHMVSNDGDEGYPGKLSVSVSYKLTNYYGNSALEINYSATTNQKTIVNLTNHTYFNLGGYASGDVLSHTLNVDADSYLPTNEKLKDRAIRIVAEIAHVNASTALKTLLECNWNVKIAILMLKCDLTPMESKEFLRKNCGVLRRALASFAQT